MTKLKEKEINFLIIVITLISVLLIGYGCSIRANQSGPLEPIPARERVLLLNQNSSKYLAVAAAGKADGDNVIIYDDIGQNDIWWILVPQENDRYMIRNFNSGKYLAVDITAVTDGENVIQWQDVNQRDILWDFQHVSSSCYKIRNANSGKYLGVSGSDVKKGGNVIQQKDTNQADIVWCFESKRAESTLIPVITDIVIQKGGICPDGYHGLRKGQKASVSNRRFSDVNEKIGGDTIGICAKMEKLPLSSSREVLTGINVSHWPGWKAECPQGFVQASGNGNGKLTTNTKGRCWRQGLCVRWTPLNEIANHKELEYQYISDLYLEFSTRNLGLGWQKAGLDIHKECGGIFVYLHALYSGLTPESYHNTMSDVFNRYQSPEKGETEENYLKRVARDLAPRIYLHPGEDFYPSSLEYYLPNVYLLIDGHVVDTSHQEWPLSPENLAKKDTFPDAFLHTKQKLKCDSCYDLDLFRGQNPSKESVPVYTIFSKKSEAITDIVYFLFYPYNRGKRVCIGLYSKKYGCAGKYSTFGHHVGDWEHMTIRLENNRPTKIFLASHDKGKVFDKDLSNSQAIEFRGTHPIVYSALGSHGLYEKTGGYEYKKAGIGDSLIDYTGKGVAWYTWENLKIFGIYYPPGSKPFSGEWTWLSYEGRWGNPRGFRLMPLPKDWGGHQWVLEHGPGFPRYAIDNSKLE